MTEQFGAIPVRAFGDTRLSAADFRLLGARRSCEAYLRNPAEPRVPDSENRSHAATGKLTNHARQGDRGSGNREAQGHFMLPIKGGNKKPQQSSEPDWNGWARWLVRDQGFTPEEAWSWLMSEVDRIKAEQKLHGTRAGVVQDRQLKKRRKGAA